MHPIPDSAPRPLKAFTRIETFADQRRCRPPLPADGSNAEHELAQFAREGIDVYALANQLQEEGAKSFVKSWNNLMNVIDIRRQAALRHAL
jgi:transaldolase